MLHQAIIERTKREKAAGRRAVKQHAADARQREIEADMREQAAKDKADPIPLEHNREPTEPGCYTLAPAGYIYLPDEIRSCIERADRAYHLAYHPPWTVRLRRWIARKVWA